MKKVDSKVKWYFQCWDIAKSGPYASQVEAYEAAKLVGSTPEKPKFAMDLVVWPEAA